MRVPRPLMRQLTPGVCGRLEPAGGYGRRHGMTSRSRLEKPRPRPASRTRQTAGCVQGLDYLKS